MTKKIMYFTTPIYYVNAKPHIGHAYTTILCDTFSRFHRFLGSPVHFLTGTDEHGEKILKVAEEKGLPVMEHINQVVPRFQELWQALGIEYDDFIRTTEERHIHVVQRFIAQLHEAGEIYLGKYKGWYCTPCETFWTQAQLINGNCPQCGRATKELEEDNYFFRMSAHQQWLIKYIESHPRFIFPESKEKEVLSFLKKEKLEDLCVSRPKARLSWGIPMPFDDGHVLYVWFDALLNYVSAIGYLTDAARFQQHWPAEIHFMAKDILRHHAVYWPIMLHAAGIEMPKMILAHGFWTMEGTKMSKSLGNIADPYEILGPYGSDTLRYFLLREVTLGSDGAYADEYVVNRFNTDLANDLGNLVHRSFSMLEKYRNGVLPQSCGGDKYSQVREQALALQEKLLGAMIEKVDPRMALAVIWELISRLNRLIENEKPWSLAKDTAKAQELDDFFYHLFEALRFVTVALKPFLPITSAKMAGFFGMNFNAISVADLKTWGALAAGAALIKGEPLFPKVEP